jgi:RNA polymerase sigma-70 factor, ECF subfamily
MGTEEQVLIDRVSQGDQTAFGPLMALHSVRIRRMIAVRMDSRLRGRVDESDVFQELQIDVLRRLPDYVENTEMGFFEWLRFLGRQKLAEISRRHIHAQVRDVRREERPGHLAGHDSSIALASFLVGDITSPSLQVSRREIREKLDAAIASLDDFDREALLLRHAEQLSATEAAIEAGVSASTFRQRHLRALKRLRAALVEQNLDWVNRDE